MNVLNKMYEEENGPKEMALFLLSIASSADGVVSVSEKRGFIDYMDKATKVMKNIESKYNIKIDVGKQFKFKGDKEGGCSEDERGNLKVNYMTSDPKQGVIGGIRKELDEIYPELSAEYYDRIRELFDVYILGNEKPLKKAYDDVKKFLLKKIEKTSSKNKKI